MSKVILGGGLSGLSAAYYLTKLTPNQAVTLLESSSRTGGWIKSDVQENDVIFEQGPRTIRPRGDAGANTLQLIEELKLNDQIVPIVSGHHAAQNRMIYANGSLHLLPSSLAGLFRKQEPFSKPLILHLLNDMTAKKKQVKDESIYDFIDRRFGREVADFLISPLICGICAGNAKEISVKFLMKQLFEYEQKFGSISRGFINSLFKKPKKTNLCETILKARREKWSIYSFKNGCETLPIALRNNILENNVDIRLSTKCTEIVIDKGQIILNLNNKETVVTDYLVSAIPASSLGLLLQKQHPKLSQNLNKLTKNVSVAVINLLYETDFLKNPAFGLLVAPKEQLPVLGIIYDSCCFPSGENCGTSLTVMMGGYWFEQHFGKDPQEQVLLDIAKKQVNKILNVDQSPVKYKVNVLHQCLPQYIVGHEENLSCINDYIQKHKLPIYLCGASYYGVGINDVIVSAKEAVQNLLKDHEIE